MFSSSTREIPADREVPRHVAIVMDGNGRWAKQRFLPRIAGHGPGVEAVRETVRACVDCGVEYLTLFAFSSENWRRPADEVSFLLDLFVRALEQEISALHKNRVRLRVVGDRSRFDPKLIAVIEQGERLTANNSRLTLTIAANYGGRWDIVQAVNRLRASRVAPESHWTEADIAANLAMSYAPEPDLFIRTGGEQRISNFLLWQLAYTELYFTETLWPDFDGKALAEAIESFRRRERRFGRTSEQLHADAAMPEARA
jgi:undecaprenyl diphosphate synthase